MPGRSERLTAMIGRIYEASTEPEKWESVLGVICDELRAEGALLGFTDLARIDVTIQCNARLDPELLVLFNERHRDNPWTRVAANHASARGGKLSDTVVPYSALRRTALHADILAPQRIRSALFTTLLTQGSGAAGLALMYRDGPRTVTPALMESNNLLTAHLGRALYITSQLHHAEMRRHAAEEAIDRLRRGVFMLDALGGVCFVNTAAGKMIAGADGLRIRDGQLHVADAAAARRLAALQAEVLAPLSVPRMEGVVLVPRPSGRQPYVIILTRVPTLLAVQGVHPAVIGFITDPDADLALATQQLGGLFGLTPMEARIAVAIVSGKTLPAAARALGIRPSTARTHLKSVFDKTGIRSQTSLVRMLTEVARCLPLGTGSGL